MQAARREIAIIDDDRAVRESLTFLLEVIGYPAAAYESAEALLACRRFDYIAGIILDQNMPGLTGLELAATLRSMGWTHPILLVTGVSSSSIRRRAAELQIDTVLEKPPLEADILAFISTLSV